MNWKALFEGLPWFMFGMLVCALLSLGEERLAIRNTVCAEARLQGIEGKLTICQYWSEK